MESKTVLVFMDLLVLCALGATMYMMRNVSASIKVIREGKSELQQLLQQLNIYISNAQHAIDNMKNLADEKGKIMQKHIDAAVNATEELQFIQRASENVAARLEKLTGSVADTGKVAEKTAPRGLLSKAEKELADAMASLRKGKGDQR